MMFRELVVVGFIRPVVFVGSLESDCFTHLQI